MLELSDAELNGRRYENENCLNRIEKLVSTFLNIYMKELNVSNVDWNKGELKLNQFCAVFVIISNSNTTEPPI